MSSIMKLYPLDNLMQLMVAVLLAMLVTIVMTIELMIIWILMTIISIFILCQLKTQILIIFENISLSLIDHSKYKIGLYQLNHGICFGFIHSSYI